MAKSINYLSYIEMLRFLFAILIVGHHVDGSFYSGKYLKNGYLCVEFFFFLTGYFTTRHFFEKSLVVIDAEILRYTFKKMVGIFPYAFISVVLNWIILFLNEKIQLHSLLYIPFEVCFLPMTAFYQPRINDVLWYLTVLMIELPLYIYIIKKYCVNAYFLFLISIASYMFLYLNYQTVAYWIHWPESIICCLFRGCAGLCVGGCIFHVSRHIKNCINESVIAKSICTFVSLFFIFSAIYLIFTERDIVPNEMLIIEMMVVSLILVFANKTYLSSFNNILLNWLGKMSAIIYCVHPVVLNIYNFYFNYGDVYYNELWFLCVALSMILSEMMSFIVNMLKENKNGYI